MSHSSFSSLLRTYCVFDLSNIISVCPFGVAWNLRGKLGHVSIKKSLKIPKGKSQVVKRIWTDKTMVQKDKRTNNDLQNITQETKERATRTPVKSRWTQVLRKGKQLLLHMWHPSCYSYYKPGDKSWTRKGPDFSTFYIKLNRDSLVLVVFLFNNYLVPKQFGIF
jgi:hypothetical protein